MLKVGAETGALSTAAIMQVGEDTLQEFKGRGGVVTLLQGDAKAGFDQLMNDQVKPEMADLIEPEVLEAAQAFAAE